MISLADAARQLGITTGGMTKKVNTLGTKLDGHVRREGRYAYIDEDGIEIIRQSLRSEKSTADPDDATQLLIDALNARIGDKDAQIATLTTQLDNKDTQIAELNARLADVTSALLAAQKTVSDEQLLHAGTMQKQLTDGRLNIWGRLFGKRQKERPVEE